MIRFAILEIHLVFFMEGSVTRALVLIRVRSVVNQRSVGGTIVIVGGTIVVVGGTIVAVGGTVFVLSAFLLTLFILCN